MRTILGLHRPYVETERYVVVCEKRNVTRRAYNAPDIGAEAIPNSAVMLNSSPTCCGVAPSAAVANHGMHVSFATNPSAFAAAANVITRWRLLRSSVRQSPAAFFSSRSIRNSSSSSSVMSIDMSLYSSSRSAATLMSGSSEYPAVHANAAPEMRKNTDAASPVLSATRPPTSGPMTRPNA